MFPKGRKPAANKRPYRKPRAFENGKARRYLHKRRIVRRLINGQRVEAAGSKRAPKPAEHHRAQQRKPIVCQQ